MATRQEKLKRIEESLARAREQAATIGAGVEQLAIEKERPEVAADVRRITAGISALAEVDTTLAPPIDVNAVDIAAVGNGLVATDTQMQELLKTLAKQAEEASKRAATAQKGILAGIAKRKEIEPLDTQELIRTTLAEFGLTPESVQKVQGLMGQLTTYNQQLANLQAQTQQGLVNIEQRLQGRPGVILRGEQALYEKQQNIRISSVAAQASVIAQQIQMERGLWSDARSTANMIVSAATYDQQQKVADIEWGLDTYKDLYDMATSEEQTAWNRAFTLAKDELDKQQDEWKTKLALNQRAAEAGVFLGWDSTYMGSRTVEELNTEYAERIAEQVKVEKARAPEFAPPEMVKEYQAAGGLAGTGMTQFEYVAWRTGRGVDLPRDWADAEIRKAAAAMKADDLDYQAALDEFGTDATVLNQDKARIIVAEIYGEEIPTELLPPEPPREPIEPEEFGAIDPETGLIRGAPLEVSPLFTE